ncbi:MAG: hydrogenase maturation protease [Chloroflexota bacterium]|nr:hydrogenase maturation protease [Chloroflexota bacterium]
MSDLASAHHGSAGPIRVLIAGVGNVLRGDDGFGVEVARRLMAHPPQVPGAAVVVIETGIGGLHLVQELLSGYDALVILDAVERGAAPGTLFLLEPEPVDPASWPTEVRRDFFADTHYAEPSHALALAGGVGVLPPRVLVVGCQVAVVDDLLGRMTPAVARAVDQVTRRLSGIVGDWLAESRDAAAPAR